MKTVRLAELLGAFSFASDLGRGQPMGHVLRTCRITMALADKLGLTAGDRADVYYTALLVHAGCTAGAPEMAAFLAGDELKLQKERCLCNPGNFFEVVDCLRRNVAQGQPLPARLRRMLQVMAQGEGVFKDVDAGCSEVGARIAARLGMAEATQKSLFNICETWNGKGPHGLKGADIPLAGRIVNVAMILEVYFSERSLDAARDAALARKNASFDPEIVGAVVALCDDASFWQVLGDEEPWDAVLDLEPEPRRYVDESALDSLALSFADLIDLKANDFVARSRRTAALAEAMAKRLRLSEAEVTLTRRAAMVQDVGLAAVPSMLLKANRRLTEAETEKVRLHPYYTERILSRSPLLEPIGRIAAMHHERLDGGGYFKGLQGNQIQLPARVLMAATAFLEIVEDASASDLIAPEQAIQILSAQPGHDAGCVAALAAEMGAYVPRGRGKRAATGLSEREMEVLSLISRGLSNKECADRLALSNHTVRHHLESIYDKIGVTSRAGAVLYAVDNNLLN